VCGIGWDSGGGFNLKLKTQPHVPPSPSPIPVHLKSIFFSMTHPYANVFDGVLPKLPLEPMEEECRLFKLHKKYWNKSIDDDERAWVEGHGRLTENDGSEVVRGCFALDLGIRRLMTSKLWVRQDYWRIYDHCHSHCEAVRTDREQGIALPPLAIITGQPGIGESSFFS
jgi:hypothetical protein